MYFRRTRCFIDCGFAFSTYAFSRSRVFCSRVLPPFLCRGGTCSPAAVLAPAFSAPGKRRQRLFYAADDLVLCKEYLLCSVGPHCSRTPLA